MKEKKARGQGGPNSPGEKEEEKNTIEKLEDDFKGTIFNVLYVLLKDDETSLWKHILEIILDFIQIYHYSFARFVNNNCLFKYYRWVSPGSLIRF